MKNRKQTWVCNGISMRNECRIEGDVCHIKLTQDKWCQIDINDMELVGKYRWCSLRAPYTFYSISKYKGEIISMHRLLMNTPEDMHTDHKNMNGLINCRYNLRIVTRSENMLNRRSDKDSSSKYPGVAWHKRDKKWQSRMTVNGRPKFLGMFLNEREAGVIRARSFVEEYGPDMCPEQSELAKQSIT